MHFSTKKIDHFDMDSRIMKQLKEESVSWSLLQVHSCVPLTFVSTLYGGTWRFDIIVIMWIEQRIRPLLQHTMFQFHFLLSVHYVYRFSGYFNLCTNSITCKYLALNLFTVSLRINSHALPNTSPVKTVINRWSDKHVLFSKLLRSTFIFNPLINIFVIFFLCA